MKFNYKKFFELAELKNIKPSEVKIYTSSNFEVSIFQQEIDSYSISSSTSIQARGIYNDNMGFASCNKLDNNIYENLTNNIITAGNLLETDNKEYIFEGSKKYKKVKTFNKELNEISKDTFSNLLFEIEKKLYEFDKRICNVEVSFQLKNTTRKIYNSYGLRLSNNSNYFVLVAQLNAKVNNETVSDYDLFLDNDFSKFDINKFVNDLGNKVISKLNPTQVKSGKYKVLLNQESTASLLNAFIGSIDAEEVQKGSSLLKDKLNQQICSKNITIYEKPLMKNIFATAYDDEAVATYNKTLINKGILNTYLYNLTTAKKDGTLSTGNGYQAGSKIKTSTVNIVLKPGKNSFEDTIKKINKGVYITEISGLHAGLNSQSGEFNLQSQGFLIENGKITSPLSLIVLSGNLFDMFNNVSKVCNDLKSIYDTHVPSILIKKLNVAGK